jgi:trk system potassium uptake protein TrkH
VWNMSRVVDWRAALNFVGTVCRYLAVPMSVPVLVALLYGESPVPFLVGVAVTLAAGTLLERLDDDPELGHREGFLMVAATWLVVPTLGAVPYLVASNGVPFVFAPTTPESVLANPANALFESMSGFTTTGSTVLGAITFERHGRAILMWRQLTQWLGGMGIVVLMVAILPELSVGGARLVREEAPGFSVEKLTPRIRETARALWLIYAAFTALCCAVYFGLHLVGVAPKMGAYNAVAHALTTMPTGGFSPEARSVEAFSPAVQWAVMPFMLIAGTNFALFWYAWRGEPRRLVRNNEFRGYVAAVLGVGALVAVLLYSGLGLAGTPVEVGTIPGNVEDSLRHATFQSLAIVTTTGYASMDFNTWDQSAQLVLLFGMFLGGSAGSAAGSIKIVRWLVVGKLIRRELFTTVHPDAVRPVRFSGEVLDDRTVRGLVAFVFTFLVIFAVSSLVVYADALASPGYSLSALEATSVVMATLGNVGPGFGLVGPMNSFGAFSNAATLYMVVLMWIGRLEILSVLVVLTPAYWRR